MLVFLVYGYTNSSMCIIECKRAKKITELSNLRLFVHRHDLQIRIPVTQWLWVCGRQRKGFFCCIYLLNFSGMIVFIEVVNMTAKR